MSAKVLETVARIMIERIEARRAAGDNVAPWRKTWNAELGAPRNLVSGHAYRGVNLLSTWVQGYASPFWVTAKNVRALWGRIKKGERYTPIIFWRFPTEAEKKEGKRPFCRFYRTWNVEQCEGLDEAVAKASKPGITLTPIERIAAGEKLVASYQGRPEIRHGAHAAYYTPSSDAVTMPSIDAFESAEAYYRTLFHELGHSTGHRNRLARLGVVNCVRFASHEYSEEELIAELTASFLAAEIGIATPETDDNSAAYLDHWLKVLKAEPTMLTTAAGAAAKAVDLIKGVKWETEAANREEAAQANGGF